MDIKCIVTLRKFLFFLFVIIKADKYETEQYETPNRLIFFAVTEAKTLPRLQTLFIFKVYLMLICKNVGGRKSKVKKTI